MLDRPRAIDLHLEEYHELSRNIILVLPSVRYDKDVNYDQVLDGVLWSVYEKNY